MTALRASDVIHVADPATSATASDAADKRSAPRRRVLKGAVAAYNDRHCTIPCIVRDISATGARIRSDGTLTIPDSFELIIDLDGTEADCEVVWRKGIEIGVRFLGVPRRTTPKRRQTLEVSEPDRAVSLRRRPKSSDTT